MNSDKTKTERQAVTISLNKETYLKYKKFCEDKHMVLSRKVEALMIKEMEEEGQDGE